MVFNRANSPELEAALNSLLPVAKEAVKHNIDKLVPFPGQ